MTPEIKILHGDCREVLRTLPEQSVHTCVTSPPYFGLRDYGTGTWEGGDPSCLHKPVALSADAKNPRAGAPNGKPSARDLSILRGECPCGARRVDRQIGQEPTPEEFVAAMVQVFREVRRVLRDDGTLWLNLGDTYASAWPCNRRNVVGSGSLPNGKREARPPRMGAGLKEKDLIGIPWRAAFALQADGWWLRSAIVWYKPNPMPESVTDRPTNAYEMIFLLAKSERYFYDHEAIKEPASWQRENNPDWQTQRAETNAKKGAGNRNAADGGFTKWSPDHGRNRRNVWTVPTKPFAGAHFATFPPELIEPCIKAGCPEGGTVLDPFGGSGTTAVVAKKLGRGAVLIDLNPANIEMAQARLVAETSASRIEAMKAKSEYIAPRRPAPLFEQNEEGGE